MNLNYYKIIISCFLLVSCHFDKNDKYSYTGSYFNIGKEINADLQILAPGLVSTGKNELNAAFNPDGDELYFTIAENNTHDIYVTRIINGKWSEPQLASFSTRFREADPFISPDGNRLYFISNRPLNKEDSKSKDWDIWYVNKTNNGWSQAYNIGEPVNSIYDELYVSFTRDSTIYFASNRRNGFGDYDIYSSKYYNNMFEVPNNLGESINSDKPEQDPFISSDESFLLFTSENRSDGYGSGDIYISYNINGTWSKAKNLGSKINTKYFDFCPFISPNQKLFLLTSNGDVFWISIDYLNEKLGNSNS